MNFLKSDAVVASTSIEIDRPLEETFRFVFSPDNIPAWMPRLGRPERITDADGVVGARYKQGIQFLGAVVSAEWTFTEVEENKVFAIESSGGPFQFAGRYQFEDLGGRTRLSCAVSVQASGLIARFVTASSGSILQRELEGTMDKLVEAIAAS